MLLQSVRVHVMKTVEKLEKKVSKLRKNSWVRGLLFLLVERNLQLKERNLQLKERNLQLKERLLQKENQKNPEKIKVEGDLRKIN